MTLPSNDTSSNTSQDVATPTAATDSLTPQGRSFTPQLDKKLPTLYIGNFFNPTFFLNNVISSDK